MRAAARHVARCVDGDESVANNAGTVDAAQCQSRLVASERHRSCACHVVDTIMIRPAFVRLLYQTDRRASRLESRLASIPVRISGDLS